MPQFYFNLISDSGGHTPDDIGLDFVSLEEAYLDAFRAILEISFDMLKARRDPNNFSFAITDRAGLVLIEIPFSEALCPGRPRKTSVLPDRFLEEMNARMLKHRELRADLVSQLSRARLTIEATRALLRRSRASAA